MPRLTDDQYRALAFLTGKPNGRSEWPMLAHGFSLASLTDLIRTGLATTKTESRGSRTPVKIVSLRITEDGWKALSHRARGDE
jgi:hypothetical protein